MRHDGATYLGAMTVPATLVVREDRVIPIATLPATRVLCTSLDGDSDLIYVGYFLCCSSDVCDSR